MRVLQAFLEMADEMAATTMVNYFTNCTAQLRGRAVYVQFSNHKELKTDQTHSNAVSIVSNSAIISDLHISFCFIFFQLIRFHLILFLNIFFIVYLILT